MTGVAIVTGAGRGIGAATALALARHGFALGITARTKPELDATAAQFGALVGADRVVAVPADVADAERVNRFISIVREKLGPIDVLVNNAGVVERVEVAAMSEAQWDQVIDVNLKGTFLATHAVLPEMLARKAGRIVNVSSISGTLGTPRLAAYCAAKWGVIGFSKALAAEVKEHGIFVQCVLPGSVDTAMLRGSGFAPDMTAGDVAKTIQWLCTAAPFALTGGVVEMFG